MARPLRIEFAGAFYHVTSRGNQRCAIYVHDADRLAWLDVINEVAERFQWRIYAYCQMGNHFHLLIETPKPNLARCMQHLNSVYTLRFNRRHARVGHLLQGRYHAVIVDSQRYLLEVARYVLLNPVRAGLVQVAADWPWSSFRATACEAEAPTWLASARLLGHFSNSLSTAIREFRRFIGVDVAVPSPWNQLRKDIYLGDDEFIGRVQAKMIEPRRCDVEIPKSQRLNGVADLAQIFAHVDDVSAAVTAAYATGEFSQKAIADHLGVHYSTISRMLARHKLLDCKI